VPVTDDVICLYVVLSEVLKTKIAELCEFDKEAISAFDCRKMTLTAFDISEA